MLLDSAAWAFRQLGAAPDLARMETLSRKPAGQPAQGLAGGLTGHEAEVLRLVAVGKTNGRSLRTCSSARRRWPGT